MISNKTLINTRDMLSNLNDRQGGSLYFNTVIDKVLKADTSNWKVAAKIPADYKEFSISIFNTKSNTDVVKLVLFINPKDFTIGQTHNLNNSFTRRGWVNVAWGNQQATISATGVSAGFYFYDNGRGGITNYRRRGSPAFMNLMDLIGMFKNNGWYFLDGVSNPSLFKDGKSRVITVMDSIRIEYDGSSYIGAFNTFTLNDLAESPYKMEYTFEFIVSSFGMDLQGVSGHIARDDNQKDNQVHVALQGFNIGFKPVVGLDADELNRFFPPEESMDPTLYDYKDDENKDEETFYGKDVEKGVSKVNPGTFRITRGWRDGELHGGKCDFRTHTGTIYSATEGKVIFIRKGGSFYGVSNYVIVQSTFNGKEIYVRYFHLDPSSIAVQSGSVVQIGTVIGREGTDGGKYPPHCDFEVKDVCLAHPNYYDCERIDCSKVLDNMWKVLHAKAETDPDLAKDFKILQAKHPKEHEIDPKSIK